MCFAVRALFRMTVRFPNDRGSEDLPLYVACAYRRLPLRGVLGVEPGFFQVVVAALDNYFAGRLQAPQPRVAVARPSNSL